MVSSVTEGGQLHLECSVAAWPAPSLGMFRDRKLTKPVGKHDPRLKVNAFSNRDSPGDYKLVLDIANVTASDGGQYFCHAVNSAGNTTAVMGVSVLQPVSLHRETLECCRSRNVSSQCVDVCHKHGLDYPRLAGRPECLSELASLVSCLAEGAEDRTDCCLTAGVPQLCSGWCRGEVTATDSSQLCAISFAKQIIG